VIFGVAYSIVGIVSSALAGAAGSEQTRVFWRVAAWAVRGVLYAAHIRYEHFRLGNSPGSIALHVAMAVAVGAFGLAAAATVHSLMSAEYRPAYVVALVAWPVITALPALVIALALSATLARVGRGKPL
jgi:hypothetical protein